MPEITQRHRDLAAAIDTELLEIELQGYGLEDHSTSNQEMLARRLAEFEETLRREAVEAARRAEPEPGQPGYLHGSDFDDGDYDAC